MKKAILLILLMATTFYSYTQTPVETTTPELNKNYYLKKSKSQKIAAIVLISGGGALMIGGVIVAASDLGWTIDLYNGTTTRNNNGKETLGAVMLIAGAAAMLGSIPFFVSAHKNKKKALSLSFKNEPSRQLQGGMVFNNVIPSLNLNIRLRVRK